MDHHYLPQFYLRNFVAGNGQLFRCWRPNGRFVCGWCSPRSTAFEPELYALESYGDSQKETLETQILTPIDTAASPVLKRLTAAPLKRVVLDDSELAALASFLASLPARHSKRLKEWDHAVPTLTAALAQKLLETSLADELQSDMARNLNGLNLVSMAKDVARTRVAKETRDQSTLRFFLDLAWQVLEPPDGHHFVTTDSPLLFNFGLATRRPELLTLPLSPGALLFGHPHNWALGETRDLATSIARAHNVQLLRQRRHCAVYLDRDATGDLLQLVELSMPWP